MKREIYECNICGHQWDVDRHKEGHEIFGLQFKNNLPYPVSDCHNFDRHACMGCIVSLRDWYNRKAEDD